MSKLQIDNLSIVIADENLSTVVEIVAEGKRIIFMLFPEDASTLHVNESTIGKEEGITATTIHTSSVEAYLNYTLPETLSAKYSSELVRLFLVLHVYPILGIDTDEYLVPNK